MGLSYQKGRLNAIEDLIFSANAVLPLFILILVGYFLARVKLLNTNFLKVGNDFCFQCLLPVLLFSNIYHSDFSTLFNPRLVAFLVFGLLGLLLVLLLLIPFIVKENTRRGVVIQALFRGNYLLFGVPICQALYGAEGASLAAMSAAFVIPIFNFCCVVILAIFDQSRKFSLGNTIGKIVTNPLIIGSVLGILALVFHIQIPEVIEKPMTQIANMATPLALIILGGDFKIKGALSNFKYVSLTTAGRLLCVPMIMLSIAVALGFHGAPLAVLIAVFASPIAVSSYVMAKSANADHELAGQLIVVTSLFAVITVFLFVYVFRIFGFL